MSNVGLYFLQYYNFTVMHGLKFDKKGNKTLKVAVFIPSGINLFVRSVNHFFNMHKEVLEKY